MTARPLFCWFDTEYSTLELERARLLEVALIVTDDELRPITPAPTGAIPPGLLKRDGFSAFLAPPPESELSDFVRESHQPLLARCRREGLGTEEVDTYLASYMDSFPETTLPDVRERPFLAGNSVYADYFLARRFLPRFLARLSYRMFDVTTLKLEWLFHYRGKKYEKLGTAEGIRELYLGRDPIEGDKHDAYYDVQASLTELAFYRSRLKMI
jgi:oligoribonuclease (3'-5' exoribonuclease)